jgi:hypothetical protein
LRAEVSGWLADQPSVAVVCRDRAGGYAEAGRANLDLLRIL